MIKLLILDVDGIMTDGKKYYDNNGLVCYKTFCDKDWTAIKRFRALDIQVMLLTGDPFNEKIAIKRNIPVIVNRQDGKHSDKVTYLPTICELYDVTPEEIVFCGDDIFDSGLMRMVKHKYCPIDAPYDVRKWCITLPVKGGENFVAKLFDHLQERTLIPNFDFDEHMAKVYELDLKEKF